MSYALQQILEELEKLRAGSVEQSDTNSNTLVRSMVRSDIAGGTRDSRGHRSRSEFRWSS